MPRSSMTESREPLATAIALLREARRDTMSVLERQQQAAAWKVRGKATRAWMKMKRGGE